MHPLFDQQESQEVHLAMAKGKSQAPSFPASPHTTSKPPVKSSSWISVLHQCRVAFHLQGDRELLEKFLDGTCLLFCSSSVPAKQSSPVICQASKLLSFFTSKKTRLFMARRLFSAEVEELFPESNLCQTLFAVD